MRTDDTIAVAGPPSQTLRIDLGDNREIIIRTPPIFTQSDVLAVLRHLVPLTEEAAAAPPCDTCGGEAVVDAAPCRRCNGSGKDVGALLEVVAAWGLVRRDPRVKCSSCRGSGRSSSGRARCGACDGTGLAPSVEGLRA